ncbi:MAG: hypothetical protein NC241_03250 [Bacteroides sp.]|nr:hypothetical protein [Bacteroides sp.]MCM1456995.1 hypothetical protein [Lachnoclostridium sp.]
MIDQLITLSVEIEALLRVLRDNPSPEAKDLLEEKFEQFSQLFYTQIPQFGDIKVLKDPNDLKVLNDPNLAPAPAPEPIKLDEMLCRREAKDLTRAFTLNDKFRFTRELFDGDKTRFADALNMLMAMRSLDEARDYLAADLAIDPDSEAGADFITIITNHFNGR